MAHLYRGIFGTFSPQLPLGIKKVIIVITVQLQSPIIVMPYECREIDGTHRLVNKDDGEIAMTDDGEPRDGGGHDSSEECGQQASTINNREYNSPENNPSSAKRYRNPR